jgi:hypothetical protein
MDAQNDSFILPGQRTIKIQDQDQDKAGQWWWYKGRGWVILLRMHASFDTVFIADTKMTEAQRMISIRRNTKTIWLFCRTTIAKMFLLQISQRIYYFKIEASPEQSQSRQRRRRRRRRRHRHWFDLIQSITTRQFKFFISEWIQHILSRKRMRHGWVGLGSATLKDDLRHRWWYSSIERKRFSFSECFKHCHWISSTCITSRT